MKKLITTFCFAAMALAGYSQNCFWHENMETIDSVSSNPVGAWTQNTRLSNSGIACDSAQVQTGTAVYLESPTIDLTGNFFVVLSFYHIARIDFFDQAIVEVSNDNGVNWSQLTCQEFDSTLVDYAAFCGQANVFSSATTLDWDPGVPGTVANNTMWHFARFDVSNQIGNVATAKFRFKLNDFNGGGSGGYPGWFIDDICLQAAACELNPPSVSLISPVMQGTIYNLGPFDINANINDQSGILSANLTYVVNPNTPPAQQNTIPMTDFGGGIFSAQIPAINDGDTVCYSITAVDNSGCANAVSYPASGCIQFIASSGITFPYCDNFDINQLWTDTVVAGTAWQLGQPNTWPGAAHSSPSCWEVGINQQYLDETESYLYSPVFSFIGVSNAWIEFWANSNCELGWDGARLDYTTDMGVTWNVLGTDLDVPPLAENWYNDNQLNSSLNYAWTSTSQDIAGVPDWFKAKHNLSILDGVPAVQFRFVFTSDLSVQDEGFAIDDICIKEPQPQDAGVSAIIQPTSEAPAGQCLPVIVTIQNYGSQPITSTDVTYVPNGGSPVTHTWTGNLAPGASINDTLPCFSAPAGAFGLCAYTSLTGDGDLTNDTMCFSGNGIPVLIPSNCDDFESGNNGWVQTSTGFGAGNFWDLGAPAFGATTGAHSGTNAWDINLTNGYIAGEFDTLSSPIYDVSLLSNSNLSLSFWRNNDITVDQDGIWVEYTINGGTNWQTLGSLGDINGVNWYNQPSINFTGQQGWDGFSNGWVKSTYFLNDILSIATPANIRFRLIFDAALFGSGGTGVSMDDFCVTVPCANDVGLLAAGSYNLFQGIALAAGSTDSVRVVLHNYGSSAQTTGINIFYDFGTGPVGPYPWTGTIPPNGNITITLPATYVVPSGGFNITAWTNFTGDCEPTNDTANSSAVGIPTLTPSNCDDFENGNIGWIAAPLGGNNEWQLGAPAFGSTTGAHSGTNAWDINLNSGYVSNENDTLFSPIYDVALLSNSNLSLSFWRNNNTVAGDDGLWIEYTADGGITWQTLGGVADPNSVNWYNQANLDFNAQAAFDGNTAGWVKSTYFLNDILSTLTPPTIRFRAIFYAAQFGFGGGTGVSLDDFCVTVPCANDLGLFAAQSVNAANGITMGAGTTDSIQVTIHNYGTATQSTFDIWYTINGGTPVGPIAYSGAPIPPNGNVTIILPPTYIVPASQFNIVGWVALPGDCEPLNDTAHSIAVGVPTIVIDFNNPYCDDFENGNIGWTASVDVGGDPGSVWELGAPNFGATSTTHSGVAAWDVNLNSQYTNNAISVLTSPIFDLTNAVDTKVDFWQNVQSESDWDGTRMEYTIDGGITWTILGTAVQCDTINGTVNWYNDVQLNSSNLPAWTLNGFNTCTGPTGWYRSIHALPAACNNQPAVQLRYIFTSDGSVLVDGYSIDDFCLSVPVPLTVTPVSVKKSGGVPFIFPGQTIPFETKILNDGTTAITSLTATLWIDNNPPISVDVINLGTPLNPSATIVYPFVGTWTATPGIHNVCASTILPNGNADLKPLGDTTCTSIQVFDSAVMNSSQRCYDFESGAQWVTCNPYDYKNTSSWQQGNAVKLGGPHSPVKAWFTDLAADYVGFDSSALYSPLFVISGGLTYNLSFWTSFDTERNYDGGTVEYNTNYGNGPWIQLGNNFDPNWMNTYSITALNPLPPPISSGWSGNSGGWMHVNHNICIPIAGTQNVLFRWRFHSDGSLQGAGWAIDDACFELVQPILTCVTGIEDVKNEFSLVQNSPNPFSDVTTISFSLTDKGHTQLQIVDVTGKIIATPVNADMNAGNYTVDVNAKDLAGGIYFYTLTHNASQITRKMVVAK